MVHRINYASMIRECCSRALACLKFRSHLLYRRGHRQSARGGVGRLLLHRERVERRLLLAELRLGLENLSSREARCAEVFVRARSADRERVEGRFRDAGADHVELRTVRDLMRLDHGDELEVLAEDGSRNELRSRGANAIDAATHEA